MDGGGELVEEVFGEEEGDELVDLFRGRFGFYDQSAVSGRFRGKDCGVAG
jgi:hypothetical protein